jgi:hypothetical protein
MHGQLPFEVKGMGDAVPTIDFSPDRVADPPYSLERVDVNGTVPYSALWVCIAEGSLVIRIQI